MKTGAKFISCAIAGAICALVGSARASMIVNSLTDTGSLQIQTTVPSAITSVTLTDPYGAPPVPTIVAVTNGFALTFTVTSDFLSTANTTTGSKISTMDGMLNLVITFNTPVSLTTNVYENGIYSQMGSAVANVTGKVTVSNAAATETHSNFFPTPVLDPSGTWSIADQLTGFSTSSTSYNVSIDNTLLATSTGGSALIAKKDFTIIFTTDGSAGNGQPSPEPASLGVLALGGVALLARRRK